MDAVGFLKHVLDPDRLKVVGLVAVRPSTADELAVDADVTRREVLEALAPLAEAGIVARDGDRYRLVREALRDLARDLPRPQPPAEAVFFGMTEDEGEVLARFFRGRRLVEIPMSRGKRRVVLQRLALEFEPGVYYDEAEVNDILGEFHADHAALRRHLVDEEFLKRSEGRYWRVGGRVDISGSAEKRG